MYRLLQLHTLFDYCGDEFLHALVILNAALDVQTAHALAKLANLQLTDEALLLEIVLVSDYDYIFDRELAVEVVLVDPLVQMVKAVRIRDIEREDAAVGAPIVARCKRAESLLTCRVPYLQAHS